MTNKYKARIRRGLKTKHRIRISERVRLVIFRSATHIYSQIVKPTALGDKILAVSSTIDKELRSSLKGMSKVKQAHQVGQLLGKRAKDLGIDEIAFDRAGYSYHGRVKALAEGAREAGLNF